MDLGFEGDFWVNAKSIKNPQWITARAAPNRVKVPPTNFNTVFACDIKPSAQQVWEAYFRKPVFHLASIVDLVKQAKLGQFTFPHADVVTGGFPCQDFSLAGKRQGFRTMVGHDMGNLDTPSVESRGMLYYWMREVIALVRPKVFVAENVKGLVSLGDVKNIIVEDFKNIGAGYIVLNPQVLHAGAYGVPQTRERVIFIGLRRDALNDYALHGLLHGDPTYDPYPAPTHNLKSDIVTVRDALFDLGEPAASSDLSHQVCSHAQWYGKHVQGQIEINPDGLGPTIRAEHHGNIEFRRLSPEHGGRITSEFSLPERRLTVRECARIQTFPDDFGFIESGISGTEAYRLIGNAIPPLLAYHIAQRLNDLWDKLFYQEP